MLREEPAFFPGVEFPVDGWYKEREIEGKRIRPMAPRAGLDHPGGAIQIQAVHPFPHLGPQTIRVLKDDKLLVQLHASEAREWGFDWPEGKLLFVADSIFEKEDTGQSYDVGGWLGLR